MTQGMLTLMLISWHLSHALCLSAIRSSWDGKARLAVTRFRLTGETERVDGPASALIGFILCLWRAVYIPLDESQLLLIRMSKEKKSNMRKERRRRWEGRVTSHRCQTTPRAFATILYISLFACTRTTYTAREGSEELWKGKGQAEPEQEALHRCHGWQVSC